VIKIEVDVRTAAAIRQCLFREQDLYTYDPTCCPQRIKDIRDVIVDMDKQIDNELNYETGGK
tara:strand:+ start:291 stop:476 length:186 start_codon:yes stop_codon:yes gene_type:complete